MSAQPLGGNVIGANPGKVFVDAIRTTIGATLPQIVHVEIVTPAADAVLMLSHVPVLGVITAASVIQVPPNEGAL
jgi:hypothetical protein